MQRLIMRLHIWLYRITGGAIGWRVQNYLMLLLTTTGRKSGQPRVTPLVYLKKGNEYILIASNGGAQQHPLWYRNLLANAQASIQVGKEIILVTARTATPEEREQLWPWITGQHQNFAEYQKKTDRVIPVVVLTPNASTNK